MSDPFDAFESALGASNGDNLITTSNEDPAAEFLAREQAELAKIENDNFDTFGDFGKPILPLFTHLINKPTHFC